jgi:hypothetical protein
MEAREPDSAESHFIEDVAIAFEQSGLPRMAGRIMGWLLISDPPQQSATQIAAKLGASKGSVSTMTRLLLRAGAIEIVGVAGARSTFFRITSDAFSRLLTETIGRLTACRELSERGLSLMQGRDPAMLARLEAMQGFYAFVEHEIPDTIRKWPSENGHVKYNGPSYLAPRPQTKTHEDY